MSQYSVLIQWSEDDKAYIAIVPELPGLSAFGYSPEEAIKELSIAKESYLAVLEEDNEEIPEPELLKPFSGQIRLRLPKSLHQSLANEAKNEGISLNTHIIQLLSQRNPLSKINEQISNLEDIVYKAILSTYPSPLTASAEKNVLIKKFGEWKTEEQYEISP